MGLKKLTAILFISLASMIMLAFAVMPHHHHGEYICFEAAHCESEYPAEKTSNKTNSTDANHGCVRNLFQTQISRTQSLVHSCDDGHCHHFIQTLFILSDRLNFLSLEAENKNYLPGFYREKLHPAYLIFKLSGRAPPFRG